MKYLYKAPIGAVSHDTTIIQPIEYLVHVTYDPHHSPKAQEFPAAQA